MPLFSLLAFSLLCWISCATARAGEPPPTPPATAIWSGLILATNDPHPAQPPAQLGKWAEKLRSIFGYNQFELVGEYSERMDDPYQRWLVPSRDFSLSVTTHTPTPGGRYPMTLVLFENHRRLAEIDTRLHPDHPLFIRGPLYAGGQLVIVLRAVDAAEAAGRVNRALPPPPAVYYGAAGAVYSPAYPPLRDRVRMYPTPSYFLLMRRDRYYGAPSDRVYSQHPGNLLDPRFMRP